MSGSEKGHKNPQQAKEQLRDYPFTGSPGTTPGWGALFTKAAVHWRVWKWGSCFEVKVQFASGLGHVRTIKSWTQRLGSGVKVQTTAPLLSAPTVCMAVCLWKSVYGSVLTGSYGGFHASCGCLLLLFECVNRETGRGGNPGAGGLDPGKSYLQMNKTSHRAEIPALHAFVLTAYPPHLA